MTQYNKSIIVYLLSMILSGILIADLTISMLPSSQCSTKSLMFHGIMVVMVLVLAYTSNSIMREHLDEARKKRRKAFIEGQPGFKNK